MNTHRKLDGKTALCIVIAAYLLIVILPMRAPGANGFHSVFQGNALDTIPVKQKKSSKKVAAQAANKDTSTISSRSDSAKLNLKKDSTVMVDTLKISKDSIDAPITYSALDSGVLLIPGKKFLLYGKAKTDYKDLKLGAATIQLDQEKQEIKAFGATDTTGNPLSKPEFIQGTMKTVSDTISYNFKTQKGLIQNTFLQEGEIYVNAQFMKKINADEIYAKNARFTTCNLDTPHFAFRANRMKLINNKLAVTGRVYPEFEEVPIPMISIPFGIFPLNQKRHSGFILPAFTSSPDFGLGLEGMGYYKVINDNMDITTRANLYSYGGWNLNLSSKYLERYKYLGSVSLSFINNKTLNQNPLIQDEYNTTRSYMIVWSHNSDNRARPGTNFSANVNFGSTRFNQSLLNNPFQNYQNQLSSSINYTKDWTGKYNLSINLNHNSNSNLRLVNMSLPTVNFNVVTLYPFQKKDQVGSGKWYEKIGIGYSGNFQNQLSFYDTAFNFKRLLDTAQWGAQHNIPITLSLPSLGPVTVAPSISYQERWYGKKQFLSWDSTNKKVDTAYQKGFYTARQMSFGVGFNTRVFGTYKFPESSSVVAIRHEIRPSIAISYQPDFGAKYHYSTQVDTLGTKLRFSQFDGGIISSFSEGAFGGISFGVDNLLEMKVRNKKDTSSTADADKEKKNEKKIKLLDGFGFNSSYNLLADSFALGNFSIYARSTLFEKLNISASANLDPYQIDNKGYRINRILWDPTHLKFGRITGGNLAFSTSFRSKPKDGKDDATRKIPNDPFMTPDEQQRQLQFVRSNPAEFTDFNIPWNLTLSYSLSFTRLLKTDFSGFTTQTNSNLNFNGDFSLTDKWKLGGTGYYDVTTGTINQLSMFITREMHCWQMAINVTPIGLYRSFNITINPKSGILRDLKINRSRTFSNY